MSQLGRSVNFLFLFLSFRFIPIAAAETALEIMSTPGGSAAVPAPRKGRGVLLRSLEILSRDWWWWFVDWRS
jgi:hypothetical protein